LSIEDTVAATGAEVVEVAVTVNGTERRARTEVRTLLSDFLRHDLGLTGTHVGCEHGACGACTVLVDDVAVRACLMLAVQVSGREVTTVEGLAEDGELSPLQDAMWAEHGLQCGFCTPGILMTVTALLEAHPQPSDEEIRVWLAGNLCRCTGYVHIVRSVRRAAALLAAGRPVPAEGPRL